MGTLSDGRAGTLLGYIAGDAVDASADHVRVVAAALATVHSVPVAGVPELTEFPVLPSEHLRSWITPHPVATAALQVVADTAWTARSSPRVLVHGDFWTGNVVWSEGRVVGILDWDNASLSSPGVDLGKARLDLALKHGVSAADEFLDEYTRIAGAPGDQVFWDLRMALDGMPDPGRWWVPTYHRLGLTDLEPGKVRVHFEEYLRRCLERLAALGSS